MLDIIIAVDDKENSDAVPPPLPIRKPNAGWKKIEENNRKRWVEKMRKQWDAENPPV